MRRVTITRLELGSFMGPSDLPGAGMRIVVTGFLIRHPDALLLVDTGFAEDLPPEWIAELDVRPITLAQALGGAGLRVRDIDLVANCHLHADHAGGNRYFTVPIHVQRAEIEAAQAPDYTVPAAVALDTASYVVHDGETDLLPGVHLVPTPGHTPGHQAVVVESETGTTVLAGQAFRWASEFALAAYAYRLRSRGEDAPSFPDWVSRVVGLDPARVLFAHDLAIWTRSGS